MPRILVFQHVPFEPLGSLDQTIRSAGIRIRYVNFDRHPAQQPDPGRYHGLVVLGGPMAADQVEQYPHLDYECDAIRSAIDRGLPVLGICLGAQLIARALGGETHGGAAPEYGWVDIRPTQAGRDDPLIGHFRSPEAIFQWHGDTFTLPTGAVHLAESDTCALQAFRVGERVYGFQFHLEADRALIERWLAERRESSGSAAALHRPDVLAATDRHMPRVETLGRAVFGEFVDRFFDYRRRRVLESR